MTTGGPNINITNTNTPSTNPSSTSPASTTANLMSTTGDPTSTTKSPTGMTKSPGRTSCTGVIAISSSISGVIIITTITIVSASSVRRFEARGDTDFRRPMTRRREHERGLEKLFDLTQHEDTAEGVLDQGGMPITILRGWVRPGTTTATMAVGVGMILGIVLELISGTDLRIVSQIIRGKIATTAQQISAMILAIYVACQVGEYRTAAAVAVAAAVGAVAAETAPAAAHP